MIDKKKEKKKKKKKKEQTVTVVSTSRGHNDAYKTIPPSYCSL